MEQLVALPSITKLSDRVIRVLGQNPGKFTLQGTNTYLLGTACPRILIDTGEGKEEYISLLEEALLSTSDGSSAQLVSDVIITHKHADHHGGLPSVLDLLHRLWQRTNEGTEYRPPRIHKFPLPSSVKDMTLSKTIAALSRGTYAAGSSQQPFHDLAAQQGVSAPGADLRVLHTPGHTTDSICLHLVEEDAIFTADSVLGQGTAVFENLSDYISSLRHLITTLPTANKVYPGHGPVVEQGRALIQQYIDHRLEREEQIFDLLRKPPLAEEEAWTAQLIVSELYATYPQNLWPAAERGVKLHLEKLEVDGKVERRAGQDGWVVAAI